MTAVCLSFDCDAASIWYSTFKQVSPGPLSRGEYGMRVGLPRLLDMLDRQGIKATFFVPAHTARTYPEAVRGLVENGHEVGLHGLIHESPVGLSLEEERASLYQSFDVLSEITGVKPVGYRSPAWDLSDNTISLLAEMGLLYDSSMMAGDYHPYKVREGDAITEEKLSFGAESPIVELPVAWELDDFPHFQFLQRPLYQGLRLPEDVYLFWKDEFDAAHEERGVFILTCHPEIIGRAPRVRMLEKLVEYMCSRESVEFLTMRQAAHAYLHAN